MMALAAILASVSVDLSPATPTNFTGVLEGNSARFNWSGSSGATAYRIRHRIGTGNHIEVLLGNVNTWLSQVLLQGTCIIAAVRAENSFGVSHYTTEVSVCRPVI